MIYSQKARGEEKASRPIPELLLGHEELLHKLVQVALPQALDDGLSAPHAGGAVIVRIHRKGAKPRPRCSIVLYGLHSQDNSDRSLFSSRSKSIKIDGPA